LRARGTFDDILLAGARGPNHLSDRLAKRVILPRDEPLTKAHHPEMDDGCKVQRIQTTKATTLFEDGGPVFFF
jgi:hypothetical protein